jgi:hypothetical protein
MQERRRFEQMAPFDKRLSEEAERLRKEARGTPPGGARQAYSQGAACGNRLPYERVAFVVGIEGSDILILGQALLAEAGFSGVIGTWVDRSRRAAPSANPA